MSSQSYDAIDCDAIDVGMGCGCLTVICLLIVAVCFLVFRGCVRLCV